MSSSIRSSKRKLESILDAISDGLSKQDTESSKKPRLATISVNRRPISRFFHFKPATKNPVTKTPNDSATYKPLDRKEFRRRLLTFRSNVSAWPPKHDDITEVKWAARGWELISTNQVECKRCHARVVIDLEVQDISVEEEEAEKEERIAEAEAGLVSHYKSQILDGHDEGCPWRQWGSKANLYRIQFNGFNNAVKSLQTRFESLSTIKTAMPREVDCGENVDIGKIYNSFRARAYSVGREGEQVAEIPQLGQGDAAAFVLALFGWARDIASSDAKDVVIHCDACFARVGLWMYERVDENGQLLTGGGLLPTLYANEAHYHDCPWINKRTQEAIVESIPGVENHNPAWRTLSIFLERMDGASVPEQEDELATATASPDRAMRDAADKERVRKVKELTRSFSYKKAKVDR